jgi:hypothetical protein
MILSTFRVITSKREIRGQCRIHWEIRNVYKFFLEILKEDPGVDGKITLKWSNRV